MISLAPILSTLHPGVRLVAVSKFHPAQLINEAYQQGQRIFGESRVQELQEKQAQLPSDIEWHFIGHLQPNKVKYIAPYISLIHAVDTEKLLCEIEKQGAKCNRRIPCLLELHIAAEESKFGFSPESIISFLEKGTWQKMSHVQIVGLMCMASNTDNLNQVRSEFRRAHELFSTLKQRFFPLDPAFKEQSWGMSRDYLIAMEEGATMVRIGTAIFGER